MAQEEIPLADIHVHSDCSHTPESIKNRSDQFGIEAFSGKTVAEVARIIQAPPGADWNTWYKHLKAARLAYISPQAIGALIEDVIRDASQNGVGLFELRVSLLSTVSTLLNNMGKTSPDDTEFWQTVDHVFQEILLALERTKSLPMATDLVVSISCQNQFERYTTDLMEFCRRYRRHIAGIDLTNERDNPPSHYRSHIEDIRGDIRGLTVHCMETASPSRGWDVLDLKPDRIGHGLRIAEDPKLVERFAAKRIPIEVCLRSNLVTGTLRRPEDHPLFALLKAGIPIMIGSDGCNDGSTLKQNYDLIQRTFGLPDDIMRQFKFDSWEHAFRNIQRPADDSPLAA